jgi:hypothetical protein
MGVNAASFRQFSFLGLPHKHNLLLDAILPLLGFLVCFALWISLPDPAKIMGGAWLFIGLLYLFIRTRGFRKTPMMINFSDQ